MDDEDGTCLLDVLCDPQALNDFLHGTNELESGDLLINPSESDPSLFADSTSPVSLLADDPPSQDAPPPGCVDLSFLEEALLGSPEGSRAPVEQDREQDGGVSGEAEEEEACDILRQSLQEADITEQTLAQEAGLAQSGESLQYPAGTLLSAPPHFLPKPLTAQNLVPKDTQVAVEPPQPSLLAVGPGCPSLKPTAPQLMGLLPGTVFPAPTSEPSFSLNPTQASGMLIQKALPSVNGRPLFTAPALRASPTPGILLPRAPLPIQPKLPVSIQPRLVQISPKLPGQKTSPGLTFVSGTSSPNILLSTAPSAKQPPPPSQGLSKPLSLQLLNQTGSIVIQQQGIFPAPNQFILPGQPPVHGPQPPSTARQLLSTAGPAGQAVRHGPSGQLVDGAQILTSPPGQLNFSPVFTTPTGQLAVRQGTILSGPLQLQPTAPAIFQMPAHLAGAFASQAPGQRGTLLHSTTLGNQITVLNSQGVLGPTVSVQHNTPPDLASVSIVNGPSVVQGLPFVSQGQRAALTGAEGSSSLQSPALLLPERPREEEGVQEVEGVSSEEQLIHLPQTQEQEPAQLQPAVPVQAQATPQPELQLLTSMVVQPQVVTSLPAHAALQLQDQPTLLRKDSLAPEPESQLGLEEGRSVTPLKQLFVHHLQQQVLQLPSPPATSHTTGSSPAAQAVTLPSPLGSAAAPNVHLTGQAVALSSPLTNATQATPPTNPGSGHTGTLCSPLIGQTSQSAPPVSFSSPPSGQTVTLAVSGPGQGQVVPPLSPVPRPLKSATLGRVLTPGGAVSCPLPTSPPTQQPASLSIPGKPTSGLRSQTDPVPHPRMINKPAAVLAVDGKLLTLGLRPASPKVQGPPVQGPLIQTLLQPQPPVQTGSVERPVNTLLRRQRFQQQICSDHSSVMDPDVSTPFVSLEDSLSRLLPYHTCVGVLPSTEDFYRVDEQFEVVSSLLLKRTQDMLNKYRQLLLQEAQQVSPSAEMVMLERLFLQDERAALSEEKRIAKLDPESFIASLYKPGVQSRSPVAQSPPLKGSSSSPPWAMLSNRPPGLKTYRSSSRGGLKLTIKHEAGSRKVVHNSACESRGEAVSCASAVPAGKNQECGELTNGNSSRGLDFRESPQGVTESPSGVSKQEPQTFSGGFAGTQAAENPGGPEESPLTDTEPCPPAAKRARPGPAEEPSTSPEDSALSEHLQSAIDSILELQRLQGPLASGPRCPTSPQDKQEARASSALEEAVNSILDEQV
nr:PREDICTED: glioma tumor suppressor candidate region gene 1 protein-like isoform X1 [Lepisosteus oculatus]XP_015206439.1 PREDICTED: glioma tumor suppressor candidate region gene 1 protein-like isoform X1 [Lepisosteus oculatus]